MTKDRSVRLAMWAQLADMVASVGVLVTLLVLVVEIRVNTQAMQAVLFQESMSQLNDIRMLQAENPELSRLWDEYLADPPIDADLLSDPRLQNMRSAAWGIYENAYYAHQRGLLGDSEWERFERAGCGGYRRDQERGAWSSNVVPYLTAEYSDYLEVSCE